MENYNKPLIAYDSVDFCPMCMGEPDEDMLNGWTRECKSCIDDKYHYWNEQKNKPIPPEKQKKLKVKPKTNQEQFNDFLAELGSLT